MRARLFTLFLFYGLSSQLLISQYSGVLPDYIKEGLESNLSLKQKEAGYEKSIQVLKEAKSWFYPQVSLNARYSLADGGRLIEFPVGDWLNPVYSTLNALTGTSNFPDVENETFQFLRPHEHETKIQVIQPLINTDIHFNKKIKLGMMLAEKTDLDAYKRHLVKEIKVSYYNVLKSIQLLEFLQNTKRLAEENLRVNEKLFQNNKLTRDKIFRAVAELSKIEQQIAVAEKDNKIASAYFNFLLNRPLDSEILIENEVETILLLSIDNMTIATENALERREEISKLGILEDISATAVRMNQMKRLPEILLAADYGFQGARYRFTGEDDFVIASAVLRWNLFHGFQNRHQIRQSQIDERIIRSKKEEAKELVKLEVIQSWYELQAVSRAVTSAEKEYEATRLAFEIVDKQYNTGMVSLLEYLDARTTMVGAGTNKITSRYEYLSKMAEYERVACLFPFND